MRPRAVKRRLREQEKLRFDKCVCVEAIGRSGGLAIFWMEELEVRIQSMDAHYIDCWIKEPDEGRSWRMTGVYGWSEGGLKHQTWELINRLGEGCHDPWLLGGDFNAILKESEKRGGEACNFNELCAFRGCLDKNDMRDIDSVGYPFTWSNKRLDGFIEEKIDRYVANSGWWELFPWARVENLIWDGSDHYPIFLSLKEHKEDDRRSLREDDKLFRFEARWLHHMDFEDCIRNIWGLSKVKNRGKWCDVVEECGSQLKKWHRDVFSASQNRMGWLVRRLKVVRKMAPSPSVLEEYRRVE